MKDNTQDAFQTKYRILILYYNTTNKVNKIQMSHFTVQSPSGFVNEKF